MGIRNNDCFCECVDDMRTNLERHQEEGSLVIAFGKGGLLEVLGLGFIDNPEDVEDGKVILSLSVLGLLGVEFDVSLCAIGSLWVIPVSEDASREELVGVVNQILGLLQRLGAIGPNGGGDLGDIIGDLADILPEAPA